MQVQIGQIGRKWAASCKDEHGLTHWDVQYVASRVEAENRLAQHINDKHS